MLRCWPFSRSSRVLKRIRRGFLQASERAHLTEPGELGLLYHHGNGEYCRLEGIGPAIWRRLQQPITLERLLDELQRSYEVDPRILRADTERLLLQLCRGGYLQFLPPPSRQPVRRVDPGPRSIGSGRGSIRDRV